MNIKKLIAACMLVGLATACTKTEVPPTAVANAAHINNTKAIIEDDPKASAVMPREEQAAQQ